MESLTARTTSWRWQKQDRHDVNIRLGTTVAHVNKKEQRMVVTIEEVAGECGESSRSTSVHSLLLPSIANSTHSPTVAAAESLTTQEGLICRAAPTASTVAKLREGARFASTRVRVSLNDRRDQYKPISSQGQFSHYYLEPFHSWWNKNERVMLSKCLATTEIREPTGSFKPVINAASHNYAGLYDLTPESERLQRLCLDKLPFADSKAVQSIEIALHAAIADFYRDDFCFTTSTGYASNLVALRAIVDTETLVVLDKKCHSSIYTGVYLARPKSLQKFAHNDVTELENILYRAAGKFSQVLVVTEGLYSMDGSSPPLDQLCLLKQQYGFSLYCDEAHSFLSLGTTGRGCLELWNDEHPNAPLPWDLIDIRTATLSKSVGAVGGFICGTSAFEAAVRHRVNHLRDRGHESLTTPTMIQTLDAFGQSSRLQNNLKRLRHMAAFCRDELKRFGIHVYGDSTSPVLPIYAGRPTLSAKLSYLLRQYGLLATPVSTPAVDKWQSRVRICLSADHNDEQVNELLDCIIRATQEIGIVRKTKTYRIRYFYSECDVKHKQENAITTARHYSDLQDLIIHASSALTARQSTLPALASTILEAGHASRAQYGVGTGGSRWVIGTFPAHLEVESRIAAITGMEAGMTLSNAEICLSSTVAALCRPLLGCTKHYFFVPHHISEAVSEGLRICSKKNAQEIIEYKSLVDLLLLLKDVVQRSGKKTCVTLYIDAASPDMCSSEDVDFLFSQLSNSNLGTLGGTTVLLNAGGRFDLSCNTAQYLPKTQVLMLGSFYQAFGLPGGYVTGDKRLIQELRMTSRGYMFSTSPQPYVMSMIAKALEEVLVKGNR